jgi:hypothetical protein
MTLFAPWFGANVVVAAEVNVEVKVPEAVDAGVTITVYVPLSGSAGETATPPVVKVCVSTVAPSGL